MKTELTMKLNIKKAIQTLLISYLVLCGANSMFAADLPSSSGSGNATINSKKTSNKSKKPQVTEIVVPDKTVNGRINILLNKYIDNGDTLFYRLKSDVTSPVLPTFPAGLGFVLDNKKQKTIEGKISTSGKYQFVLSVYDTAAKRDDGKSAPVKNIPVTINVSSSLNTGNALMADKAAADKAKAAADKAAADKAAADKAAAIAKVSPPATCYIGTLKK